MRRLALLTVLATLCSACDSEPELFVQVDSVTPIARVNERYLSFAVDTAQVLGGEFWNPASAGADDAEVVAAPYDFDRPRIATLAAGLSPAVLRVGGTAADLAYYDLSDDPVAEAPEPYELLLTRSEWDAFADFAQQNDLQMFFTLNAGAGPRDANGKWTDDNARELMQYAAGRDDPVVLWELGNEVNAFLLAHGLTLTPEDYARDVFVARDLVDEEAPDALLAGPSSAYWPEIGDFTDFYAGFMPGGGRFLDAITWHYYPQQSHRCPVASREAGPEVMLDPDNLDEALVWAEQVEAERNHYAAGAEIWLGETGNAQCGGEPGVSDSFAGSLWWLDQLGAMAARGHQVTVRQTLSGSDYGLIDDVTEQPNPDYWVSALWVRLMGPTVLDAWTDDTNLLRAYAHCAPARTFEPGAVTVALINLSGQPMEVGLDLPGDADLYLLEAASLDSRELSLNGQALITDEDGALPDLVARGEPHRLGVFDLPGRSLAFAVAKGAGAEACE